jgi:hypothetical protein
VETTTASKSLGAVEDFSEVVECLGFWKPLRRGVERELIHVAQDDDVLVRMSAVAAAPTRPAADADSGVMMSS